MIVLVEPFPGTPGKGLVPSPEALGKGVAMDSFTDSIAAVVLSFFKGRDGINSN